METKTEFLNQTQGYIGAVRIKRNGDEVGIAVEPGGRVWLSDDEQVATANAPQHPKDNPFVARPFKDHDSKTGEVTAEGVRAPLKLVTEARELASVRPLSEPAVVGSFAAGDTGHVTD